MTTVHTVDGYHYNAEKVRVRPWGVTVLSTAVLVDDEPQECDVFIPIRNVAAVITLRP